MIGAISTAEAAWPKPAAPETAVPRPRRSVLPAGRRRPLGSANLYRYLKY
jgi:hypothetical protein